ncbi:hypothetical protein M422DRAFT_54153 [Sphaerobolus stellatus SS14]|uniref:Uncharacterized protein n=1 Tax=Sphaerobolus stellatus (strain SS14) TaxID=990650 RepID=A0A0C9UKV9_SPHS4|nr:hypothetical protein M422DRAFT_54153 [Sphaerobolus stellatus SS14]
MNQTSAAGEFVGISNYLLTREGTSALIGLQITAILWDISIAQAWSYYRAYKDDPRNLKCFDNGDYTIWPRLVSRLCSTGVLQRSQEFRSNFSGKQIDIGLLEVYITDWKLLSSLWDTHTYIGSKLLHYESLVVDVIKNNLSKPKEQISCLHARTDAFLFVIDSYMNSIPAVSFGCSTNGCIVAGVAGYFTPFVRIAETISEICLTLCDLVSCIALVYYLRHRSAATFTQTRSVISTLALFYINISAVSTLWNTVAFISRLSSGDLSRNLPSFGRSFSMDWEAYISIHYWSRKSINQTMDDSEYLTVSSLNARNNIRQRLQYNSRSQNTSTIFNIDGITTPHELERDIPLSVTSRNTGSAFGR